MLRCMLQRKDQLLEDCGMAADWADPEKCARASAIEGYPDHIQVGRGATQCVPELRASSDEFLTSDALRNAPYLTELAKLGEPFGLTAARRLAAVSRLR